MCLVVKPKTSTHTKQMELHHLYLPPSLLPLLVFTHTHTHTHTDTHTQRDTHSCHSSLSYFLSLSFPSFSMLTILHPSFTLIPSFFLPPSPLSLFHSPSLSSTLPLSLSL